MRKNTKNTAKIGKLLELIYNMKLKLVDTSHWPELCAIDETIIYNPPHSLATDSADLKEKIQLALDPEVTAQDVNNGDF